MSWPLPPPSFLDAELLQGTSLKADSWHRNQLLIPPLLPFLSSSLVARILGSLASHCWPCSAAQHVASPGTTTCQR